MKKVLIISSHFAPDAHIGAKRIAKFCKYLSQYGWQPIVLTSAISDYHRLDETLMEQLPDNIDIHRVNKWHIFPRNNTSSQSSSHSGAKIENNNNNLFRRILGKVFNSVEFIEYSWLFPALILSRQIIRKSNIDIVFSSSPNHAAHIVSLLLTMNNRIPWICEYRDPWTKHFSFDSLSFIKKKSKQLLEMRVLKGANMIIAAWPAMISGYQSPDISLTMRKGCVIYNGFDHEDFNGLDKEFKRNGRLEMTFVGTFGYYVQPSFLCTALARLLDFHPTLKNRLRVRLVGEVKEWDVKIDIDRKIRDGIVQMGLEEIVELIPFQSHRSALEKTLNTDLLIYIQGVNPEKPAYTDGRVQAKLFEYLYANKPILALVPPKSEATRIINECNAGYIVPYGDMESAVKTLEIIWEDYQSGKLTNWQFNEAEIDKYDRRKQTKQLADVFNEIVSA